MARKRKASKLWFLIPAVVAAGIAAFVATLPPPQVAPPAENREAIFGAAGDADDDLTQIRDAGPGGQATGWVRDDNAVKAFKATLAQPIFAGTPAGSASDPLPDHVYLWDAYVKIAGRLPPIFDQNPVGSCVSFGTARALERSLGWDIAFLKAPYEFAHVVEEVIYAGSRHEIGGDRIRPTWNDPNGDGSNGSWAAKFVTTYGVLPRGTYLAGKYVLDKYSPTLCRKWGAVGAGVPDDLEPDVKKFPTGSTAQVRNWEECKRSLANGYAVAECSNILMGQQRDANGVVKAYSIRGGHCMCIDGYYVDKATGKEYGHIENSWGPSYHVGPTGWGSPNTSGGWVSSKSIDAMLKQGDSWAFSAVKGFPKRELDWAKANVADAEYALAP